MGSSQPLKLPTARQSIHRLLSCMSPTRSKDVGTSLKVRGSNPDFSEYRTKGVATEWAFGPL